LPASVTAELDLVFSALADPTRRAILERVARHDATVNQLVAQFDLTQPTVSKHLKVLEHAGLVSRGREAQFRPVRLNARPLAGAARWLGNYAGMWESRLDQLEEYVKGITPPEEQHAQ
jgi:DNA-binding transcriptional ArsR family regulator